MTQRTLAFVLGGGGARGALQVGALRALLEAGLQPDLLVGTSIGAANSAYLAVHGLDMAGIEALKLAWQEAALSELLPANYLWVTIRALVGRGRGDPESRLRDFFLAHGLTAELRFADLSGVRLLLVSADLNSGQPVLFGTSPEHSVFEGVLASAALPPWVHPLESDGRLLMDGGVASNLPIEPALRMGATEIVALDLADPGSTSPDSSGLAPYVMRLVNAVQQRETTLELSLAEARGVPVLHIELCPQNAVAMWDFSHTDELMETGYRITTAALAEWQRPGAAHWWERSDWLAGQIRRFTRRGQVAQASLLRRTSD